VVNKIGFKSPTTAKYHFHSLNECDVRDNVSFLFCCCFCRLLEHSFHLTLTQKVSLNRIRRSYYEWGFLRNETLFSSLINCLDSLATRDFTLLNQIPSYIVSFPITLLQPVSVCLVKHDTWHLSSSAKFNNNKLLSLLCCDLQSGIYRLPTDFAMPLIGTPVIPLFPSHSQDSPDSLSIKSGERMSQAVPIVITPVTAAGVADFPVPPTQSRTNLESILEANQTAEEEEEEEPVPVPDALGIPKFSYSYGSPILAVPDFSQLEDAPRLDPMISCFKSKKPDSLPGLFSPSELRSPHVQSGTKSFLESGGFVPPDSLGNFPLPQKGQSLKDFLSSLSDASQPDLDRENSHFNISEALISAFESMKVKQKYEELQEQRHLERMEAMFGGDSLRNGGRHASGSGGMRIKKKLPLRQRPELPFTETEESE